MKPSPFLMIVDDDTVDLELTVSAFRLIGWNERIEAVHDGVELLEFLANKGAYHHRAPGSPTLILLDIKMPRLDGLETLKVLKADPLHRFIPVIIFTSSSDIYDAKAAVDLGANAYLVKPVDFTKMQRMASSILDFWVDLHYQLSSVDIHKQFPPHGKATVNGQSHTVGSAPFHVDEKGRSR